MAPSVAIKRHVKVAVDVTCTQSSVGDRSAASPTPQTKTTPSRPAIEKRKRPIRFPLRHLLLGDLGRQAQGLRGHAARSRATSAGPTWRARYSGGRSGG